MSPFLAVSVLSTFSKGAVSLTHQQYDEAFDALTELLEKANDEKHRITPQGEKEEA